MPKPITSDEARIAIVSIHASFLPIPFLLKPFSSGPLCSQIQTQRTIFCTCKLACICVNAPFGAHFERAAYVLDLRAKFHTAASESPSSVNLWRERVLGLEQDVAYLQNQFNLERISMWMALPIIPMDHRVFSCRAETLSLQAGEAAAPPVTSTILPARLSKEEYQKKITSECRIENRLAGNPRWF
jgi:hypothetical protein